MTDSRVNLRNPVVAAVLAWLIPGAGHFYQRRFFKAAIYFVCVLGIFFWGCSLGEAKAVYLRWDRARPGQAPQRTLGYLAQAGVGVPALPAVIQHLRYESQVREPDAREREPDALLETIDTEFSGQLMHRTLGHGTVTGRLTGQRRVGGYGFSQQFEGTLTGTLENGQSVELTLSGTKSNGQFEIGPRICALDNVTRAQLDAERVTPQYSSGQRRFYCRVTDSSDDAGMIEGTIPRPFLNYFQVPLTDEARQYLNGKLGKQYELALVYTWIAGLLNLLAVWDAAQGPAYGYGDEEEETDESASGREPAADSSTSSETSSAAARA